MANIIKRRRHNPVDIKKNIDIGYLIGGAIAAQVAPIPYMIFFSNSSLSFRPEQLPSVGWNVPFSSLIGITALPLLFIKKEKMTSYIIGAGSMLAYLYFKLSKPLV